MYLTLFLLFYNEEQNDLYFSTNVIRAINEKEMRWAGYVARAADRIRGAYRWYLWGNLRQ
jgi:hypothetical protein